MKPIKFYTNQVLAYFLTKLYINFWRWMSKDTHDKLGHMALVVSYQALGALNYLTALPDRSVPIMEHLMNSFGLEAVDNITLYLMKVEFMKVVLARYPDVDIFKITIDIKCDGPNLTVIGLDEYTITLLKRIYRDDYNGQSLVLTRREEFERLLKNRLASRGYLLHADEIKSILNMTVDPIEELISGIMRDVENVFGQGAKLNIGEDREIT